MSTHGTQTEVQISVTKGLLQHVNAAHEAITEYTITAAKHAILDWIGVTVAGAREPLSEILMDVAYTPGDSPLIGRTDRASVLSAALINGSAGHALDYDDTQAAMSGHPTAPVLPAIIAAATSAQRDGAAVIEALIYATEMNAALGQMAAPDHYLAGWHPTATIGVAGAAAGAGRILGLNESQMAYALGLAITQTGGLKSAFGSMAKPLHAGNAAHNGLLAALLAKNGFTAAPDVIGDSQGFLAVMANQTLPFSLPEFNRPAIESNLYKYHASCYLTHGAIEAAELVAKEVSDPLSEVSEIVLVTSPAIDSICNIAAPETGLEVKFSITTCIALAMLGHETARLSTFNDEIAHDALLQALREKISIEYDSGASPMRGQLKLIKSDGSVIERSVDTSIPNTDLDTQWVRLTAKFKDLVGPEFGEGAVADLLENISMLERVKDFQTVLRPVTQVEFKSNK